MFGIKEDYEVITEGKVLSKDGICIYVEGQINSNYIKDPYFKLYDSISETDAKRIARIGVKDGAHYVYHGKNEGKEFWILNSKERKLLEKLMSEPGVWEKTLKEINARGNDIFHGFSFYCEKPNFRNIKE
jgi:hypothetical protein